MPPKNKFTIDEEKLLVQRYVGGEPLNDIATSVSFSPQGIRGILKRHRVDLQPSQRFITKEQEDAVVKAVQEGSTGEAAGLLVGISEPSVFRILKERGIKIKHGPSRALTSEDELRIAELYKSGYGMADIAKMIGRGTMTIQRTIKNRVEGVEPRYNGRSLTEAERVEVVRIANSGGTIDGMAIRFGVNEKTVARVLEEEGVEMPLGAPPTCEINHHAFDVITPESAYWLGFLVADGCLHYDKYGAAVIALGLQEGDRAHVEKFRTFIGSTHAIVRSPAKKATDRPGGFNSGPFVSIHVRSERIGEALKARGMVSGKPDRVPIAELEDSRDYWRGMVDGDGSVGIETTGRGYPYMMLCGQHAIVQAFCNVLRRNACADLNPTRTASGIWRAQTNGPNTTLSIVDWLYKGATIALDRKYEVAKAIIG